MPLPRVPWRKYSTTASENLSAASQTLTSLNIRTPEVRKGILEGEWKEGPHSIRGRRSRIAYKSPEGLKEVFPLAYEIIQNEKKRLLKVCDDLKVDLSKAETKEQADEIEKSILKYSARAYMHDPEVQYNHRMRKRDFTLPVYRHLAWIEWNEYERIQNIDRLENLHVIPDTMPTIDLRARVRLRFPGVTTRNITAGEKLRTVVCSKTPILNVQEFEEIADGALYTVVIVDPDTPDVENDSYSTTLHWAVSNIPLSNTFHEVDLAKSKQLVPFLPPHPEKNTDFHRYCVWVFRQSKEPKQIRGIEVDPADLTREKFDIRKFAEKYQLDAVGAHVWRNQYDRSTDEVREKFGLGAGRVFSRLRTNEVQVEERRISETSRELDEEEEKSGLTEAAEVAEGTETIKSEEPKLTV